MKPGALIMLIIGIVLTLFGGALIAGGTVAALGNAAQDQNGYFSSQAERFSTDSYALMNRFDAPDGADYTGPVDVDLADLRLEATSTTGTDVFVGIAPTSAVDEYLAGVNHAEIRDIESNPFRVRYVDVPGSGPPSLPASENFWVASASGSGEQAITWSWEPGPYSVVVMNADASPVVSVDVAAGARTSLLGPAAAALIGVGIIVVLIGLLLLVLGIVGLARGPSAPKNRPGPPYGGTADAAVPAAPSPARPPQG